ncbi:MAG TPA: DUF3501 family protein [Alphaproteobacteria bacterium]|jgi:hypothetical protein
MAKHEITRDDIIDMATYAKERKERRARVSAYKRDRRVEVGPFICFYFESFDTMLHQVHEMLHIERGGEPQIVDELAAYNPLVPKGRELVATMMIEIPDADRRNRELYRLGHVEDVISLSIDGEEVKATIEGDQERTDERGKTSSVHFLHFPFTEAQAKAFKTPGTKAILNVAHANYAHMAMIPEATRTALALDLD